MNKVFAIAGGTLLVAGLGAFTPSMGSAATAASPGADAVAAARDYIQENPGKVKGTSLDTYTVKDTSTSSNGATHVRFDRSYDGLPVLGGDLVVHLSAASKPSGLSLAQEKAITTSTSPKVSASKAQSKAQSEAADGATSAGKATLVVDARSGTPALAYRTVVKGVQADGQTPSRTIVVTDASTGAVRSSVETILTPIKIGTPTSSARPAKEPRVAASGTGEGIFIGSVPLSTSGSGSSFSLVDETHGGGTTCDLANRTAGTCTTFTDSDNAWGDGTNADRASAAVDVHYGSSYVNAFWDGSQMTYGDGAGNAAPLVAIDVAGHEMTHGVTENTAGLDYSGDAGGLNESTSDIFGTMVELAANSPSDTPDFLIGEEIDINGDGSPLRYMDDPSKDGGSYSCWDSTVPASDPHYSSGVGNHFFYLLANGSGASEYGDSPTCDGSTLAGIGADKAAAIWFGALDSYMTSTETYAQAREDTISSATDLYGSGSAEVSAVEAAWTAVDVS